MPEIRVATEADIPAVGELGRRVFLTSYRGAAPDDQLLGYADRSFSATAIRGVVRHAAARVLVADDAGRLVGLALCRVRPVPAVASDPAARAAAAPCELQRLYVDAAGRNRGLGSALLDRALADVAERGHDLCWLHVWDGSPRAIAFYLRRGFAQIGWDLAPVTPPPRLRIMGIRLPHTIAGQAPPRRDDAGDRCRGSMPGMDVGDGCRGGHPSVPHSAEGPV